MNSNDSATCTHPNASQHPHTNADGSTRTVTHCPSCGMEW